MLYCIVLHYVHSYCISLSTSQGMVTMWGLGGVVGLTLPVYYLPCSDLGQVVNLSLSVA